MAFRTPEILSFKNNIEQTDGGFARRKNNGDTKPPSENRYTIIIFPRMDYLFTEDIWERTHDDRDGKIFLVTIIERFFCFRPLAFSKQINHLLKTVDYIPHTSLWPSVAYTVIFSQFDDAPTPDEFSHHHRDTQNTPIPFRFETVHK